MSRSSCLTSFCRPAKRGPCCPDCYSKQDAIFNVQRAALLVAASGYRYDCRHFRRRSKTACISPTAAEFVPGLEEALRLRAPGLLGCALSGAGPSILVFFERGYEEVCDLVCQIFALHGRKAEVIAGRIARDGYTVEDRRVELDAAFVTPDVDVQAGTISIAEIFADFNQPTRPLIDTLRAWFLPASAARDRDRAPISRTISRASRTSSTDEITNFN